METVSNPDNTRILKLKTTSVVVYFHDRFEAVGMDSKLKSLTDVAENFWTDFQNVQRAGSQRELSQIAGQFCQRLGFDHFGYATRDNAVGAGHYQYFHNFDGPYGHYRYEHVYRNEPESDPVLVHLRDGLPAASFSCKDGMDLNFEGNGIYAGILGAAAEHGIRAGIGVPLTASSVRWGFMLLTTNDTDRARDVRPYLPHLCLFSHFAFSKMRRFQSAAGPNAALSKREIEVLRWASLGKTSWEIGRILRIAETTVNFHVANAARKLDTRGRHATCARAVSLGLVSC